MDDNAQKNYRDKYFTRGHWGTKIWQTLIMLLSWLVLFTPIFITSATYLAYCTHGRRGHFFWHYTEGFHEINFLIIFLLFSLGMTAVFCIAMGYIQTQRAHGLVDKWPMFDMMKNRRERQAAEKFMTARFGSAPERQNVRYYVVKPEQNLSKNQLKEVVQIKTTEDGK